MPTSDRPLPVPPNKVPPPPDDDTANDSVPTDDDVSAEADKGKETP